MRYEYWRLELVSNDSELPWVFRGTPEWATDGIWFQIWRSENIFYDYETNYIVTNSLTKAIRIERKRTNNA